jgi:hypothetical protein
MPSMKARGRKSSALRSVWLTAYVMQPKRKLPNASCSAGTMSGMNTVGHVVSMRPSSSSTPRTRQTHIVMMLKELGDEAEQHAKRAPGATARLVLLAVQRVEAHGERGAALARLEVLERVLVERQRVLRQHARLEPLAAHRLAGQHRHVAPRCGSCASTSAPSARGPAPRASRTPAPPFRRAARRTRPTRPSARC